MKKNPPIPFKKHAARMAAIAIASAIFILAKPVTWSQAEKSALASRYRFESITLPHDPRLNYRDGNIRPLNPAFRNIPAWISAFGSCISMVDLDGDGLANDLIHIDPRTDRISIRPVPGTGNRYEPFVLGFAPAEFDSSRTVPSGVLPGDYNRDGLMDLVVYFWGRTPLLMTRRPGEALSTWAFRPLELVQNGFSWHTLAATSADLDGDGNVDLIFKNYFPDGSEVVDPASSRPSSMQNSFLKAFNGGDLHFLLSIAGSGNDSAEAGFREVPGVLDPEIQHGWTLAVGAQDLDGDLLPELYLANDFGPDRLLYNQSVPGHLRFTKAEGKFGFDVPTSKRLGRDSFKGMGVDFADLNSDGIPDIFVSNITRAFAAEESNFMFLSIAADPAATRDQLAHGIAPYSDRSMPLGMARTDWAWDAKFADFDNDGHPELVQATGFIQGNKNRYPEMQEVSLINDGLLANPLNWLDFSSGADLSGDAAPAFLASDGDMKFKDIAREVGLGDIRLSRAIATADVNGDGSVDMAIASIWGDSHFFLNRSAEPGAKSSKNSFLGLHILRAPQQESGSGISEYPGSPKSPGSPAIGARVTIISPSGLRQTAQVDGGNGHGGKRSFDVQFGLGPNGDSGKSEIEIAWRDQGGAVQRENLRLGPGWHTLMLNPKNI